MVRKRGGHGLDQYGRMQYSIGFVNSFVASERRKLESIPCKNSSSVDLIIHFQFL